MGEKPVRSAVMVIGRFAPSPTGPLHFGSLIAAVGSYLDCRSRAGQWLVRMEDLDPPREVKGAASNILRTLETFGFEWDGDVMYQGQRNQAYDAALEALLKRQLLYACTCSRRQISSRGKKNLYGVVYAGTCRNAANRDPNQEAALRLLTTNETICFEDQIQGEIAQNLLVEIGDFILKRRDGLYAYHLAVTVDDAEQGVTDIVRGYDLLDSTPRQIYLQGLLGLPTPRYSHMPIAINKQGQKLSKQTHAPKIETRNASILLWQALDFLEQKPDPRLKVEPVSSIWQWGIQNWQLTKIPRKLSSKHYRHLATNS